MHALRTLNETGKNKNPFVYPGMTVQTRRRTFPMQQLKPQVERKRPRLEHVRALHRRSLEPERIEYYEGELGSPSSSQSSDASVTGARQAKRSQT